MTAPREKAAPAPAGSRDDLDTLVAASRLEGKAFLERYRALRLKRRHRMARPHESRAIAVAMQILRDYPRITQSDVRALLGGNRESVRQAQQSICVALGHRVPLQAWTALRTAGAVEAFCNWLGTEAGPLPLTCLDPPLTEHFAPPRDRYCARVLALLHPRIRLNAGLSLMLAAAAKTEGRRITDELKAWEGLDDWVARRGRGDALAKPAQLPRLMLDWLATDPCLRRLAAWRLLATAVARLGDYLMDKPAQSERLANRIIRIPQPGHYDAAKTLAAIFREKTRRRRAATADPLADCLPTVVHLADVRVAEVTAIRDAFEAICLQRDLGRGVDGSIRFAVTLPRTAWDGAPLAGTRTLDFMVVDGERLAQRFAPISRRLLPNVPSERYHLAFLGVRDPVDAGDGIPLLEAYRRGVFVSLAYRSDVQEDELAAWTAAVGGVPSLEHLTLFRYRSGHDRELANRAFRAGLVLVPIAMLHHGIAVACAVARCGLLSGARIGETLQQCHSPDAFGCADQGQYYFMARPKMATELARFYVDEATLNAVTRVVDVAARNGYPIVPTVWPGRAALGPRPHVYQKQGRALRLGAVNAALQVLLMGFTLTSHDLRAAFGRFSAEEVFGRRHIQATLHHADPAMTDMYTRPTERMKAELARRLSTRIGPPSGLGGYGGGSSDSLR